MAAAGPEGAGQELLLSPAPLKGCGISLLPLPFAPRPEALVRAARQSSAAAGQYADTWGAFVCLVSSQVAAHLQLRTSCRSKAADWPAKKT